MVHAIGSVKMAVMARYLCGGRMSQTITEESGQQKQISQFMHAQLLEADEANLLDEKDMHVFDLKPMTDPLHLVCCKACKKPIKTSQYSAHEELCRSLMPTMEFLSDRNGDGGPKKPPRMERKRSKAAGNKVSPIVAQERIQLVDPSDAAFSNSHFTGHNGRMSSVTVDAKGGPICTNLSSKNGNHSTISNAKDTAATTMPLSKRPKLLAADMVQSSDGLATERGLCNLSGSKSSLTCASSFCQDVPAPLATKIYHSHGNNDLRAALSCMFHGGATGQCSDEASPKAVEGNSTTCEVTSHRFLSEEQLVKQAQEKSNMHTVPSPPNQTIGENSRAFSVQMGGYQLKNSLSNQLIANDDVPSQTPAIEMRTSMDKSSKPNSQRRTPGALLVKTERPD